MNKLRVDVTNGITCNCFMIDTRTAFWTKSASNALTSLGGVVVRDANAHIPINLMRRKQHGVSANKPKQGGKVHHVKEGGGFLNYIECVLVN
jgi:hypothetical protein